MKRLVLVALSLLTLSLNINAEMVKGSDINDREKQDICTSRTSVKKRIDDFLIDTKYVEIVRSKHPDATFIAIDKGSPTLVTCYLREGTGKFEPALYQGTSNKDVWKVIKPENPVDIDTLEGQRLATKICKEAVITKLKDRNILKVIASTTNEVLKESGVLHHIGTKVGVYQAKKYDILADGDIIFNDTSNGIDKNVGKYKCLLEPSFKIKDLEINSK